MLNKILMGVVIVLLIVAIMPSLITHVHEYDWQIAEKMTCQSDGLEIGRCWCGSEKQRVIKSNGHWYTTWKVTVEPTCNKTGKEVSTCENCGATNTRVLDPLHKFTNKSNCTICGTDYFSQGLQYELRADGYAVYSEGKCTDRNVVIPSTWQGKPVTAIAKDAFNKSLLLDVTIPASVKVLEEGCFAQCNYLRKVIFAQQSQLTTIAASAFNGCSALETITIPKNVTEIGQKAFAYCQKIKSVKFVEGIKLVTIGDQAFYGCKALAEITIPASVTSIGQMAFEMCDSLSSLIFEDPNGWVINDGQETAIDLSNSSINASNFANLGGAYNRYHCYKKNKN